MGFRVSGSALEVNDLRVAGFRGWGTRGLQGLGCRGLRSQGLAEIPNP